jgi:hypothetical protein
MESTFPSRLASGASELTVSCSAEPLLLEAALACANEIYVHSANSSASKRQRKSMAYDAERDVDTRKGVIVCAELLNLIM